MIFYLSLFLYFYCSLNWSIITIKLFHGTYGYITCSKLCVFIRSLNLLCPRSHEFQKLLNTAQQTGLFLSDAVSSLHLQLAPLVTLGSTLQEHSIPRVVLIFLDISKFHQCLSRSVNILHSKDSSKKIIHLSDTVVYFPDAT